MSNFAFLRDEFGDAFEGAHRAEQFVRVDPRVSLFYARRTLEGALKWAFRADIALKQPYKRDLAAMIYEPSLRTMAGSDLQTKMDVVRKKSNRAVHEFKAVTVRDAQQTLGQLFHVMVWFHHTYTRGEPIEYAQRLDMSSFPDPGAARAKTEAEFTRLRAELEAKDEQLARLTEQQGDLDGEVERLRLQVASTKKANTARVLDHDMDEATTREVYIDVDLEHAGWEITATPQDFPHVSLEYRVEGLPGGKSGKVDYVMWGADGLPLALIEAKRTSKDARAGQYQARQYADALEARFGRRPLIYYSNGHEHWFWDDDEQVGYPPRRVEGFRTADQLELMIRRRAEREDLNRAPIATEIVDRPYQLEAIRAVDEAFQTSNERGALLVMATGTGKTRTVVALVDQLMKAKWAKRVLFLADRKALVGQAVKAFKEHLPSSNPVNLLTDKATSSRVYVSTYPTMMGQIEKRPDEFGPGFFDVVVIDEAHRSVFQKYRAIFNWFDSHLVGLTATPKDEVDRNTYELFGLEQGVPTFEYGLQQGIDDEYLAPEFAIDIPLGFPRRGVKYAELSEEEQEEWESLDWGDDVDEVPDEIDSEAVNRWFFNTDTVDKVLKVLMTEGIRAADSDQVGKTIIFAKNEKHARFIAERFDHNYPEYQGRLAAVITNKTERSDQVLDDFSEADKAPYIAISVDMLDTGIDVPEVVNLVFFKRVRSVTKFWQMMGRGTRLRQDLFGPGDHKKEFNAFDVCDNFAFFGQNPAGTEGKVTKKIGERIFESQVELLVTLKSSVEHQVLAEVSGKEDGTTSLAGLRADLADALTEKVSRMNPQNFIVRPHRPVVAKYADREAWGALDEHEAPGVAERLGKLPTGVVDGDQAAKRFDLVLYQLQLGTLKPDLYRERLRTQVQDIASGLLESMRVPEVAMQAALLEAVAGDEWWADATVPMLELVRRRIRGLVKHLPPNKREPVYTNFKDSLGELEPVDMGRPSVGMSPGRFREKSRAFLRGHEEHVALRRVRMGKQLTSTDLDELGRMLVKAGIGKEEDVEAAAEAAGGLGVFIRSLVGLEQPAVQEVFAKYLADGFYDVNQIAFVRTIIRDLCHNGVMEPKALYDHPYKDHAPTGPDDLFDADEIAEIVSIIRKVTDTARVDTASA